MPAISGYNRRSDVYRDFGRRYNKQGFITFEYEKFDNKQKAQVLAGSLIGTVLPLLMIMHNQKTSLSKIKYNIKEMIMLSTGSIAGGILGGYTADEKNMKFKDRAKEGIFQFFNAVIPTLLITPVLKLCKKVKVLNNNKVKAAMLLGCIFAGMKIGEKISAKVNNNSDSFDKRKLKITDLIGNIDVISGALIIAKFPFIHNLGIEKFLPFVYLWTGYQSGRSK